MIIFENRRQAWKVKGIQLLFICWAIGFLYWAWSASETYGLSPGDGGVLKPAADRYLMALIMALVGIVPLAGMIVYTRLYAVRIERQDNAVLVVTIGWLSRSYRVHEVADFRRSSYNEGRMHGRISVHAPWISLYVAGSRLPYIVDLQAETINSSAIAALTPATGQPSRRERRKAKAGR
jgi:hypothetical protein